MDAPVMLLDTAGMYFRSFYALPESLTAPDGTPVNAVRGFADMLARLITEHRPTHLVACLDADWRPAFRVQALPSYKTHRVADDAGTGEDVPDTLTPQIPLILDLLDALGLATGDAPGYEADDVIATLAHTETSRAVRVITGDRDLFQVVRASPEVRVRYIGAGMHKARDYGVSELAAAYHLPASDPGAAYADMAVLRGDPSDGLPGVPGIGDKTAAKLVSTFGSLDAVLAAVDNPHDRRLTANQRDKLRAAADYLHAAPTVVRAVTNAPVQLPRDTILPTTPAEADRVAALHHDWGLGSPVDRLQQALAHTAPR